MNKQGKDFKKTLVFLGMKWKMKRKMKKKMNSNHKNILNKLKIL